MANHGCITLGDGIDAALSAAEELETLARQFILSQAVGGPVLLSDNDIAAAITQFAVAYGPNIPRQ